MTRKVARLQVAATLLLCACGVADEAPALPELPPVPMASVEPLHVDTLVSGLEIPWGIVRLPDGRWLVSERPGRVRLIERDGRLRPAPLLTLSVHARDADWHPESGLMGMALHPDFAANGHVFIVGTFRRDGAAPPLSLWQRVSRRVRRGKPSSGDLPFENRILRFTLRGDSAVDVQTLVTGLSANHYHAGGALAVGPDRKLYSTLGDGRLPVLASEWDQPVGKVLRYELDGSIPADNPDPKSAVWAAGLRNTQGLAWLSDGTLLGIEHGPSGLPDESGRTGHDELNVLVRGAAYGWVSGQGRAPVHVWRDGVAPAGLVVEHVAATADSAWVIVGKLRGGLERLELRRVGGEWRVVGSSDIPLRSLRRIRSVWKGEDGSIYATTSNRDIRGVALAHDDVIVRVELPPRTARPAEQ